MADDHLGNDLETKLGEAADLIRKTSDPDATLVAAYDYLVTSVAQTQTQAGRTPVLVLQMFKPTDPSDKDAAKNSGGKGVGQPDETPYADWSKEEKEAFPGTPGNPDPSYMMLHLGSWCWYTSTGKKCYS